VGHREHLKTCEPCRKATDRSGKVLFVFVSGKGAQTLFAGVLQRATHPLFSFSSGPG
jgi:NADH:ubiquinone oxidoreductase subunit F (NADH-binding)